MGPPSGGLALHDMACSSLLHYAFFITVTAVVTASTEQATTIPLSLCLSLSLSLSLSLQLPSVTPLVSLSDTKPDPLETPPPDIMANSGPHHSPITALSQRTPEPLQMFPPNVARHLTPLVCPVQTNRQSPSVLHARTDLSSEALHTMSAAT